MIRQNSFRKKNIFFGGSILSGVFITAVVYLMLSTATVAPIQKTIEFQRVPLVWLGREAVETDETGWIETFLLDYASDPVTALQNNISDFGAWANVSGYIDDDNKNNTNVSSEEFFYPCVVIRYNKTHAYDEDQWVLDRCSCRLTFSSAGSAADDMVNDEYIDDVEGYKIEMSNVSSADYLYVGFWWDDDDNGYAFKDGCPGADWNITISAQF